MKQWNVNIKKALLSKIDGYKESTGVTLGSISKRAGLWDTALSEYRSGRIHISDEQIENLCRAIGVRWQDLDVDTGATVDPRIERLRVKLGRLEGLTEEQLQLAETAMSNYIDMAVGFNQFKPGGNARKK